MDFKRFPVTGSMFKKRFEVRNRPASQPRPAAVGIDRSLFDAQQPRNGQGLECWQEHMGSSVITVSTTEMVAPCQATIVMRDSGVDMSARWQFTIIDDDLRRDEARELLVAISQDMYLAGYRPRACLFRVILTVRAS